MKKNGRRPKKKIKKWRQPKKENRKWPKQKLKTNQSTKINLIGCDTIVNSPSLHPLWQWLNLVERMVRPRELDCHCQELWSRLLHSQKEMICFVEVCVDLFWVQKRINLISLVFHPKTKSIQIISLYKINNWIYVNKFIWINKLYHWTFLKSS